MGLFGIGGGSFFNPIQIMSDIARGDITSLMRFASQIALTYMTGGASTLVQSMVQQGIQQFGAQAMAQVLGKELVSMVGQQMIQQLGEQMGLDQRHIDMAQAAFCRECGDSQGERLNHLQAGNGFGISGRERLDAKGFLNAIMNGFDASPADRGDAERIFEEIASNILKMAEKYLDDAKGEGSSRSKGKGGWIRQMAEAMGKKLDAAWSEAESLAGKINKKDPSTSAEYQGAVQEFSFIMNAFSSAIKAAGQGAQTMARSN